jgi:RNA-binding protein 8A
VTGLHEETSEDALLDKFEAFGTIVDYKMPLDHRTGYVKGYALIKLANYTEAEAAISTLDESIFLDSLIRCSWAFKNPQ